MTTAQQSIWSACKAEARPQQLQGEVVRVVESQRQIATLGLVDTLEEQAVLEDLLEGSKPRLETPQRRLHYLLTTPFRYPPLRYGSRFGGRHAPSLFYGSQRLETALAETAYYRFLFWYGMTEAPPAERLVTQHMAFAARYRAERGLRLQEPPFAAFARQLTDPASYAATQPLGDDLREAGIEAFQYVSARDRNGGVNIALFYPRLFTHGKPVWQQAWLCELRAESVLFSSIGADTLSYGLDEFRDASGLPRPGI